MKRIFGVIEMDNYRLNNFPELQKFIRRDLFMSTAMTLMETDHVKINKAISERVSQNTRVEIEYFVLNRDEFDRLKTLIRDPKLIMPDGHMDKFRDILQ